jgi:SAM-dependent methyltransferase
MSDAALETESVLQRTLPAEMYPHFDAVFVRSHIRYGEFVYRLVLAIARQVGLEPHLERPGSAEEIAARAGLDPVQAPVPLAWMLALLAWRGALETAGGGRYRLREPLPAPDPAPVREEQLRQAPSWAPAYALAETVAPDYPAFLRGETTGEEVLFAPRRLRLWIDYFSNDNGLYVVNNRVGALAVEQWLPRAGAVILELGGGLGSGAIAVLERLEAAGRLGDLAAYRFTEVVPAFLRRGEQNVRARYPALTWVQSAPLDMNEPFEAQGVAPGSASIVYAVNTLHAAHDLGFTLGEVRRALEPGGVVIASECVRPEMPVYADFVFNLTAPFRAPRLHPRYRPAGGFLTPAQWQAALTAAGLRDVRFLPDIARVRREVPDFLVAAVGAARGR